MKIIDLDLQINRQEAEDENSSRKRNIEPLGPEFCAVGHGAYSEA
jgi:hypothetical protein